MSWNYRMFKQDTPKSVEGKHLFFIGECYYDSDDKPELHSDMSHNLLNGDSVEEVQASLTMVSKALAAPVIELDENGNFKEHSNDPA